MFDALNEYLNLDHRQTVTLSSGLLGVSIAWFTYQLIAIVTRDRVEEAKAWEFEDLQWIRLRKESRVIRWFEPLVVELQALIPKMKPEDAERFERNLDKAGESQDWRPAELYFAAAAVQGFGFGVFFWCVGVILFEDTFLAWLLLLGALFGYPWLMTKQVRDRATKRILRFKTRLPFAMDLLAFMIEAGASFYDGLETVVRENQGHELGDEFEQVLNEVSMGRPRSRALAGLSRRLHDDDVDEFVFAVNKGEEMGTPLSDILRSQADQLRSKRTQWMERAAEEAKVTIVFPMMLVVFACLVIMMAPFLLDAMENQ